MLFVVGLWARQLSPQVYRWHFAGTSTSLVWIQPACDSSELGTLWVLPSHETILPFSCCPLSEDFSLLVAFLLVTFSWLFRGPHLLGKTVFGCFSWLFRGFFVALILGKFYAYSPWKSLLTLIFLWVGSGGPVPNKPLTDRAELKVTDLRWRSPICGFLRFSVKISGFLRKSAVFCGCLRPPNASISRRRGESAKICGFCENLRFGLSLSPFRRKIAVP